jgi:hypothetical protein
VALTLGRCEILLDRQRLLGPRFRVWSRTIGGMESV